MVVRISDKTQNYSKVTKVLVKPKFNNGNLELDVTVAPDKDIVWLSANQMALLFDRDEKTIRKHINNIFKD